MSLHEKVLAKILPPPPENGEGAAEPYDVAGALDALAASREGEYEWRISIVDLLNLLELDSRYETRVKMAREMGFSQDDIDRRGSAEVNLWILKQLFIRIAERGGRIDADLPG